MSAINRSFFLSAIISAGLTALATFTYLRSDFNMEGLSPEAIAAAGDTNPRVLALGAVLIGIALAAAIQVLTGFFTETGKRPVNDVARAVKPAEIIADKKNERLIAVIADLSVLRSLVKKIPMTAVTVPIAGTING